jgi:hypothetical protein
MAELYHEGGRAAADLGQAAGLAGPSSVKIHGQAQV